MNLWNIKANFYRAMRSFFIIKGIFRQETINLQTLLDKAGLHPRMVLDLGTGVGSSLKIYKDDCVVIGMDRSLSMIQKCRTLRNFAGLIGDTYCLPFRDGSVSFVSAVGLTEYLRNKGLFLDEVKRILSKGGHFLVTTTQPNILNALRCLLGHRLYPIQTGRWMTMIGQKGFACLGQDNSLIQNQYLFRA